jgi:hypothetical protein
MWEEQNSILFIHPNIWKFEKVEILQISRAHTVIYSNKGMLLDKILCDAIPCVCPLIDHGNESALILNIII